METNLPEVLGTVRDVVSIDRGNIFSKTFLSPKTAERRLEAQMKIYSTYLECEKATTLAKIELEKEIELTKMKIGENVELARMNYSLKMIELKSNIIMQYCEKYGVDPNTTKDFLSKIL